MLIYIYVRGGSSFSDVELICSAFNILKKYCR